MFESIVEIRFPKASQSSYVLHTIVSNEVKGINVYKIFTFSKSNEYLLKKQSGSLTSCTLTYSVRPNEFFKYKGNSLDSISL